MKILVDGINNYITDIAYDIDVDDSLTQENGYPTFTLKDQYGNEIPNKSFCGEFYVYDTGDDPIINKELLKADLPGNYAIEDGNIIQKGAQSLTMILNVRREFNHIISNLELSQLELLYELSLLQLGLEI